MLDIVRNNKRITQVFLALITLQFAFWGVESYVRNVDRDPELASVGRSKITRQELQATLREQQERMRSERSRHRQEEGTFCFHGVEGFIPSTPEPGDS